MSTIPASLAWHDDEPGRRRARMLAASEAARPRLPPRSTCDALLLCLRSDLMRSANVLSSVKQPLGTRLLVLARLFCGVPRPLSAPAWLSDRLIIHSPDPTAGCNVSNGAETGPITPQLPPAPLIPVDGKRIKGPISSAMLATLDDVLSEADAGTLLAL